VSREKHAPHARFIPDDMTNIIDYNGRGKWSRDEIQARYATYCRSLSISERNITPQELVQEDKKWIYPIMDKIIEGIEDGDPACKLIGIEFIEEDSKFPFGKTLKSNTARALRRTDLTDEDKERIRKRVVHLLLSGIIPHEYKEYAKLLKTIGLGKFREAIERDMNHDNPYVMKYRKYLLES
jgi:hypothetical protein